MEEHTELAMQWSGPLPPPGILQQYDSVVKDGAERVFRQMEYNGKHRRRMEGRDSISESIQRILGTVLAGAFGLTAIGGGIFLLYNDKALAGFGSMLFAVAILITAMKAVTTARSTQAASERPAQTEMEFPDDEIALPKKSQS